MLLAALAHRARLFKIFFLKAHAAAAVLANRPDVPLLGKLTGFEFSFFLSLWFRPGMKASTRLMLGNPKALLLLMKGTRQDSLRLGEKECQGNQEKPGAKNNRMFHLSTLKFIFNFKIPSPRKIFFWILLLALFPLMVHAKKKVLRYGDESWILYVNPKKTLVVVGPWGEEPLVVDRRVNDIWGMVRSSGPVVIYLKGTELRWLMLQGDSGEKIAGGTLLYVTPQTGFLKWLVMTPTLDGATVKVAFDTRRYIVYQITTHGRKTVVREGLL